MTNMGCSLRGALAFFLLLTAVTIANGITLDQVISREDPFCDVVGSKLAIGRDGKIYLGAGEYVLRMNPDGSGKLGGKVTYAQWNVAANADGIIATANAHFNHSVNLWSSAFTHLSAVNDFLSSDPTEWFGPCDVQAGTTDFYGMDQNRERIVRVSPAGKIVTTYSLTATGETFVHRLVRFRVWEKGARFYLETDHGTLYALSFTGQKLWAITPGLGGDPWNGYAGAFDVDDTGRLYILAQNGDSVKAYDSDGKPAGETKLKIGERTGRFTDLRVTSDAFYVKRRNPSEFFQVYTRQTGDYLRTVNADVESLHVTYPADIWVAGQPVPLTLNFNPGVRHITPQWRVALRLFNAPEWTPLPLVNGQITPPADAGGLYQLRVWAGADYLVQGFVEIRRPGAKGSAAVLTPLNRVYYGWGEAIPITVLLRGNPEVLATIVTLRLIDEKGVVSEGEYPMETGKPLSLTLPATYIRALRPGQYWITVSAKDFTGMSQPLIIGQGVQYRSPFSIVQHGDYGAGLPGGSLWDAPDNVARHLTRTRKLATSLFVDRLGSNGAGSMGSLFWSNDTGIGIVDQLAQRLVNDPVGVPAEKVRTEVPALQAIASYGAYGIEEQSILLYMDAGLPVGTGYDQRTPTQFAADITKVTQTLLPYPAFRGWSWAANWWISPYGAAAAKTDEQRKAFETALKTAADTGAWNSILDDVSNLWINTAVDGEKLFNATLQKIAPGKLSVMTGPYRQPGIIPPLSFANADEVDLHYQSEQIQPPQVTPHNVDFYKRPGKRALGHPELWNDDGTGGMIFPTILQMAMRGADGIGWSGAVPAWGSGASDGRATGMGAVTIFRTLNTLLHQYGPWLTTLQASDPVAIPVSTRMLRIDNWKSIGGLYFDRLYEAYNACLYAHRPAHFIFAEDMKPDSLTAFHAILLVSQTVEWDPQIALALEKARKAGVPIFADDTCRTTLIGACTRIGTGFTFVEHDPSAWQDDSAYSRFPAYFKAHARTLNMAMKIIEPPAGIANPEVILTERLAGGARYLWVVNNTMLPLDPGLAWRVGLLISQRIPVIAPVTLAAKGKYLYDVFAQRQLAAEPTTDPTVSADLRSMPARLYAVLPEPISKVVVNGPQHAAPGQTFSWTAWVQDLTGTPLPTSIPARIQLLGADNGLIEEQYTAIPATGLSSTAVVPINAPPGPLTLEITELISGKTAWLNVTLPDDRPTTIPGAALPAATKVNDQQVEGTDPGVTFLPSEQHFGPHLKEIAVTQDGSLALLNAMNWDQNLYAINLADGSVRWRGRVGHHFAYAPAVAGTGFAVQGYDLQTAEGYHLYMVGRNGVAERRFALYGAPKRATSWAAGFELQDRINNFATAPNGQWVASAGDLGLAVWDRRGKLLWSQDWWKTTRKRVVLQALDDTTLLTLSGMTATAYRAGHGEKLWELTLGDTGTLFIAQVSTNRRTVALAATTSGGRVFILRDGKLVNTLVTPADTLSLSADGRKLAVTTGNQLRLFSTDAGIEWAFTGDDTLRNPRITPDGLRIAVGSELGTLYVLNAIGEVVQERDFSALPTPAWLPGGDLLVATWMGLVARYSPLYIERWHLRLEPTEVEIMGKLLAPNTVPTTRVTWGDGDEQAVDLRDNLLMKCPTLITMVGDPPVPGDPRPWQNPVEKLYDGKPDVPQQPWLAWTDINYIDSGWRSKLALQFDTFRTQLRVTGITLLEDPNHPESWLRDMRLQYWNPTSELWVDGPYLLSDSAVHNHHFTTPIEAAKFRLVSTGGGSWPAGNIRLAEIILHGEILGASHPDVVAKRPLAVLFDEKDSDLAPGSILMGQIWGRPCALQYSGAYSGGKCLALTGETATGPGYTVPFGHVVPNWDFEIVEKPLPGQYRWAQFAWKALSPQTRGISLRLSDSHYGGYTFVAGEATAFEGATVDKVTDTPSMLWSVVRVDLWALAKKSQRIRSISLGCLGGGAAFDQILLGRSEADLPAIQKK